MCTLELNSHENRVSEFKSLLKENLSSQGKLKTKMWDGIAVGNLEECADTWLKQDENSRELCIILEKYQKSTDSILKLLKEAINELKKTKDDLKEMKALAIFRDFITMFLEDVEVRFGKWSSARSAINRKIRNKEKIVNYNKTEKGVISELNDFLSEVHMTDEDVATVIEFKQVSNTMFHQGEQSETKETEENLEMLLLEKYEKYESLLRKVLDALRDWDKKKEDEDEG